MSKLNVICVLWKGDFNGRDYNEDDTKRLYGSVNKWMPVPFDFYCLTNSDKPVAGKKIMLRHNWPGWWSKIELFRYDIPQEKTLYLDLDTRVVNNLSPLLEYDKDFVTFNSKFPKKKEDIDAGIICRYQTSTILYYPEKYVWLYTLFKKYTDHIMTEFRSEQDWFGKIIPNKATFPDVWLEKLESLRKNKLNKETIFVTGHPKKGSFRNPGFAKWIEKKAR